ncbi:hypothetical protein BLOT_009355 [Blomia tropicalis]|nr:hypothetical protein BLOT_009355 [Blomia tropicalis]
MQTLPETQTRASNDHRLYIPKELNEAEYVYVKKENRKGLEPQYTGPHRVNQQKPTRVYSGINKRPIRGEHPEVETGSSG